jgi:zinc protease
MKDQIITEKHANGLKILLKEIHTSPIVSHWVWYRVGSRYEKAGKTGISHWVEHMQFKGTPKFPANTLDRAISRDGGMWNAFTYLDWTTFFETIPSDKVDLSLDLEADRMINSVYDPDEVAAERTVIISEREGSENDPLFKLEEKMQVAAFESHPYRNEVIGSIADLKAIQRDDLYDHYQKYYHPGNAIIAVAGDFNSKEMLDRLQKRYVSMPGRPADPLILAEDPPLTVEKRVDVSGPGETTYIELYYRAPNAANKDFFTISVLDSLLTGPTSLNMFGGSGISNKTCRLYKELVEKELAISVNGSLQATMDPYLYTITVTLRPGVDPESVVKIIDSEIKRIQNDMVTQSEIDRAVKQARALFAYGSENITNQAFWLGYSEMFDDYSWFLNYVKNLGQVTQSDILEMSRKYLSTNRRVVGIYHPQGIQS